MLNYKECRQRLVGVFRRNVVAPITEGIDTTGTGTSGTGTSLTGTTGTVY